MIHNDTIELGAFMPRILVVDDDISVLYAMRVILELEGCDVVIAHNGRDAIAAISTTAFDLAIVDIFMPGMSGPETIKTLGQLAPDLPVIAVSGHMLRNNSATAPDLVGASNVLGATCCLQKPFRVQDLMNAIVVCLGRERTVPLH